MRARTRVVLIATLLGGLAWAGVPPQMRTRGWAPLIELSAPGDPPLAVARIESGVATLAALLHGLEVEPATAEFLGELRGNMGSLDLPGFYATLPEQHGRWRKARLRGEQRGRGYRLGPMPAGVACRVDPRQPLGDALLDLALEIGARPVDADDGNYLAHLSLGLGAGHFGLPRLQAYLHELGRLAASCDPSHPQRVRDAALRPGAETRLGLLARNPKLRPEDIEVVGVLAEAYPKLFAVLADTIQVEDVLVFDPQGRGDYQQVRLRTRLATERLAERHPELAEYLDAFGPLLRASLHLSDARGRRFLGISLDTERMALQLDAFVRDGRLLPVEHGRVLVNEPALPASAPRVIVVTGKAESHLNGVVTKLDGIHMTSAVIPRPDGYDVLTSMRKTPQVSVTGSAFGVLPTWAIDVVIPGDIEGLTRELLATACEGNGGRGVVFGFEARQADGAATLALETQFEVLNNALVSLAFRVANDKLVPSDEARAEIWELLRELQVAFGEDLATYAAQVQAE